MSSMPFDRFVSEGNGEVIATQYCDSQEVDPRVLPIGAYICAVKRGRARRALLSITTDPCRLIQM